MINKTELTGEAAEAFPQCAQRVAFTKIKTDRSEWFYHYAALVAASGGSILRSNPFVSLVAAGLMASLPVHAMAQEVDDSVSVRERPRPEYDPLGMRLGGFNLHAQLNLGLASTDNLFATETAEQDDTIMRLGVDAQLRSDWSRHGVQIDAGYGSTHHDNFDSEDAQTSYIGAAGRLDVGSRSQINARARFTDDVEPRTDPDSLLGADPVEFTRTEYGIGAQHDFSRFRVSAGFNSSEHDYDDAGAVDQDFRDHEEQSITGRVEAELTPRVGLVLQATSDERDYDNAPLLNSEGKTYLAGVRVNLTDLLRGEITVGQFERDYDSGSNVEGTAIAANLEWYATRLTTLSFHANQSAEEDGAIIASPYTDANYGVRVDHELLRNVILTAGVRMGRRDYEVIDREDEYTGADVGVDYLVNRRVAVNLRYNHDSLESSGINRYRDYDVGVVSAGLSLRL